MRQVRWLEPRWIIGSLVLGSVLLFVAMIPVPRIDGNLVGSDGTYYYVQLRSLMIDRDLDFANEYAHFDLPIPPPEQRPTGRVPNKYALGPALLWAPFFLVAHGIALIGQQIGFTIRADGYSYLYQVAVALGSITYGALGLVLAYRCARPLFGQTAALWALGLIWLASNAFYYMVFEPSMAHMVSLFSVAVLLSLWFRYMRQAEPPSWGMTILLGMSAGLVVLVRSQDAIFLALPAAWFGAHLLRSMLARNWRTSWAWMLRSGVAGLCAVLVFSPQLLVWQYLYGTWRTSPYMADHDPAFNWLAPQIGPVLFSSFHGLFSWHPVYLIALLGLLALRRHDRWAALALALISLLNIYVVAAWWAWWQGDSFGGRMFLNASWIWLIGLAGAIHWLWTPQRYRLVLVAAGLLIIWNGLALVQYRLGLVPMNAPLTWQQMTIERLTLPWQLWDIFVGARR